MKHNYLMAIGKNDWDDIQRIKDLTDTPVSQLLREGLRNVVKVKKEAISQTRRMRETLSHIRPV
jgi:hypothetical protein